MCVMEVVVMEYTLYTENITGFLHGFPDLTNSDDVKLTFNSNRYLGGYIYIVTECNLNFELCSIICDFLIENYLHEFVFNKIYDEYNITLAEDAAHILMLLSRKLKSDALFKDIESFFNRNNSFHFENYIIFRKNFLLTKIDNFLNVICNRFIKEKELNYLGTLIYSYSLLADKDAEISHEFITSIENNIDY